MLEKDEKSARLAMATSAATLSAQPYSSFIPRYCTVAMLNQTLMIFMTLLPNFSMLCCTFIIDIQYSY